MNSVKASSKDTTVIIDLFKEFIKKNKYNGVSFEYHSQRLLEMLIKNKVNSILKYYRVEDEIKGIQSDKFNIIRVSNKFLDFVSERGFEYESGFDKIYMSYHRRIEIVKFLHNPHTITEIADEFHVHEKTIRRDLSALRRGIDYMGNKLTISTMSNQRKILSSDYEEKYLSTIHPISNLLNMTELNTITNLILDTLDRDSRLYRQYMKYCNRVFSQLSPYAKEFLMKLNRNNHVFEEISNLRFISETESFEDDDSLFMHLLKFGKRGLVQYKYKGKIESDYLQLTNIGNSDFKARKEDGTEFYISGRDVISVLEIKDYK